MTEKIDRHMPPTHEISSCWGERWLDDVMVWKDGNRWYIRLGAPGCRHLMSFDQEQFDTIFDAMCNAVHAKDHDEIAQEAK